MATEVVSIRLLQSDVATLTIPGESGRDGGDKKKSPPQVRSRFVAGGLGANISVSCSASFECCEKRKGNDWNSFLLRLPCSILGENSILNSKRRDV